MYRNSRLFANALWFFPTEAAVFRRNEIIFPAYAWSGFLTEVTLQGLQPQRLIMQDGCHEPNLSSCRKNLGR